MKRRTAGCLLVQRRSLFPHVFALFRTFPLVSHQLQLQKRPFVPSIHHQDAVPAPDTVRPCCCGIHGQRARGRGGQAERAAGALHRLPDTHHRQSRLGERRAQQWKLLPALQVWQLDARLKHHRRGPARVTPGPVDVDILRLQLLRLNPWQLLHYLPGPGRHPPGRRRVRI